MRAPRKRGMLVAVSAAILVVGFLVLKGSSRATPRPVVINFIGYTNQPGNHWRFALFSVTNQARYDVRWRGSWVEVEGKPGHLAEIVNPSLPGFTRKQALKAGGSLSMAIGEPLDSESRRWRFAMSYVPDDWRHQWLDFSIRYNLPLLFLDSQRILNPSNDITATTTWLTK